MPDFNDPEKIIYLQPTTEDYPLDIEFEASSSVSADDGSIPYGTTVSSAAVYAKDTDGTDKTSEIVTTAASVADNVVSCGLTYPATTGAGTYILEVKLTLSTGAVLPYDARRIVAGTRAA